MRIGQFLALLRSTPPKRHADALNLYALTNDFRAAVRYCRFYGIRPPSWIDPVVAVLVEAEIAEQEALASSDEGTAASAVKAAKALAPGPIREVSLQDACVRMQKLAGDYLRAHREKGVKEDLADRLIDHCAESGFKCSDRMADRAFARLPDELKRRPGDRLAK